MKLFQNPSTHLNAVLFEALVTILFSDAERFYAVVVKGTSRNIPLKLFQNPITCLGEKVSFNFSILSSSGAFFNEANLFAQGW